jgi:hypothetical protein
MQGFIRDDPDSSYSSKINSGMNEGGKNGKR